VAQFFLTHSVYMTYSFPDSLAPPPRAATQIRQAPRRRCALYKFTLLTLLTYLLKRCSHCARHRTTSSDVVRTV